MTMGLPHFAVLPLKREEIKFLPFLKGVLEYSEREGFCILKDPNIIYKFD